MAKKKNTLKPVGTYAQEMQKNLTKKQNTVGAYSDRLTMLKNSINKIKAQQEQKRAEEERQRQIRQQATDETRKMQTLSRDLQYGYGQKYDPALAYQAAQMGVKADKLRGMVEEDEKTYNALNRLAKEAEALKDTGYAGIQKDRKNYNTGNTLTLDQWFRVQGKQRDNQANKLYDNGDDPMLMSPEGRAAYRTQAENWVKHYKDQAKRYTDYNEDDALAGLFDRMYERDIANEQAIINNPAYKGTAYETTAQGRLATLESERNEARRQAVENARRMRDSGMSMKGATPEEQEKIRREVYDWILPDGYDQRTAQNKAEIDAAIDEYITGIRSPWGDSRTQADAINAANSQAAAWESRIQAADEAQKYYDLKNKWMGYAADDTYYNQSNEYVPEYAPQMRMNFDDESRRFEIEIQGDEVAKAYWYANNYQSMKGLQDSPDYANKYMFIASDPDILRTFNEMYNKDMANGYRGQRGSNLAEQFLKGLEPYLSTMLVNYQNDFFRSRAEDPAAGIAGRIFSPALQAVGGVAGTLGAITGAKKDSPLYTTSRLVSELRSQQNEDVGKWADRVIGDGSGEVAKFVLGVADSIADNIFAMGTGTALAGEGTKGAMRLVQLIMSGSATGNKMIENLDAGMDPTEAALSAVGDGVIEWLTERYSLEQIMGPDVRQLYGNKRAMASFLARSAGAEGSEEIASGVLNAGLDSILSMVYGHEDEITSRYNELITSNPTMSHEEASRIAMEEKLQEIGLEGLAGSISGLGMAGSRAISTALETRAEGRTVKSNDGGIDTMLSLAQKMKEGTESRTLADKLSAEIEKGSKVSNYDLGRLANLTALDVGETRSQVIRDTVGRNVEKQLTDAGIGEQEAKKYGEIITRSIFEGKRLSKSEIQTLGQDERAIKLWGDFNTMSQASLNLSKEVKAETKELDSIAQQVGELTSEQTGEESAAAAEVQKSIQETGSTEEAIDNLQARRSGLISESFAKLAKEELANNPVLKKSKTYLDDIMKIRLAAMTMDQLPKTALDKDVAQRFYDAAKAEFDEEDANRVVPQAPAQEGRGSATYEGAEYGTQAWKDATQGLSKMTRNVMGAVGEIAARFGNRVNLVNDPENPDIYGFEDANTGAITINVANGFKHHMLVTLAHEMTHWLEQNSRGGYNDLRSFVLDSLRKEGVNVQDRIVKIMDNYNMVMGEKAGSGLTINQAMAELVAQSSEGLLSSRNTMQALKDTNPGLFSKVREYVKDVVARINAAIRGMEYESSLSQEAKALKNYRDQLASIWLEGRKDAMGNTPAERAEEQAEENTEKQPDSNIQYKLAEYSQNEINNWKNSNRIVVYDEPETLLNFVEEAKTNKQFVKKIYLGKIDSKLSNLLTKWYPFKTEGYNLALHANEVRKAFDRHGEEDPRTNHVALSNDSFLDIIETVQNPDHVNQSNKYNGQPAIQFTKTLANKAVVVVYAVPRLHDLHIQAFHEEKIGTNKESLSQADDAKSPSLSTSETTLGTTLKQSIAQGNETENRQNGTKSYSVAQRVTEDSNGKQLSKGQQEFFKDSKAVNSKGQLVKLYHGTNKAGFTVFEDTDDIGYFFTDSPHVALSYSDTYDEYAPKKAKNWDDVNELAEELGYSIKPTDDGNYRWFDENGEQLDWGFYKPDQFNQAMNDLNDEFIDQNGKKQNYAVYLNLKNPLIIEGYDSEWNYVIDNPEHHDLYTWSELTEEQQQEIANKTGYDLEELENWGYDDYGNEIAIYDLETMDKLEAMSTREWVQQANEWGHDGVIFRSIYDNGQYNDIGPASDVYVAMNPNQIKSVNNTEPTEASNDIRFSMANAVEERADGLVAVHNLEEGNLIKALNLGGFAMPSIAIIKSDNPYNKYGKISVVFGPDTIDPKAYRTNKVYGGDAWTPVYPKVEYKLNSKKLEKILSKIRELLPERFKHANLVDLYEVNLSEAVNRYNGAEDITNAIGSEGMNWLRLAYMMDTKKEVEYPTKIANLSDRFDNEQVIHIANMLGQDLVEEATKDDPWDYAVKHPELVEEIRQELNEQYRNKLPENSRFRKFDIYNENNYGSVSVEYLLRGAKKYFQKGMTETIDIDALNNTLKETIDETDFKNWLNNLFGGIIQKSGIRNNKDYYTNAGNPRSWEQLHDEETLDNVVRIMREQDDKGENAFFGQSAILAQGTRNFKSLDEVREHKDQLQVLDEEDYSNLKHNIVDQFSELMDQLYDRRESNIFIARDRVIEAIADAVKGSRTVANITKVMNQWGFHPSQAQAQKIADLMVEISNLPTEYFEAKPQRAVGIDEIAKVILPENASQDLKNALDNWGVEYETYDGTDEDRLKKLNEVKNVQFSIRQSPDMDVNNFMLGLNEFNLPTYQEKTMLRQYKDSRTRADLLRYGIREREIERRKLLAKEKRSIKDNKRLGEINRYLDRDRAKLDSLEKELVRVTGDKGYARLMMNQENIMKNLTTGQSAAELEETVNNIQQNLDNVTKEMAERAEELKKLASAEAVVKIRQQFNARGLKDIAAKLKGQLNSELENKEIENRLALIALKMKQGQYDAENAEELADLLAGRMKAEYDGYVISELRGSTITLGPVQLKELKGSGRSLNDIRQQLAGTGIRIGVNGSTTLDSKWDDLCKVIPSLNPEENVGNQLDALLKLINDEKAMRKTVYTDENLMNINRMVLEAAQQLIPEIITDEKSLKLIRESMALVAKVSGAAKSNAEAMDEINSLIEKLQKRGKRAIVQAKKLTGDIESTIEYFDQLSLQSEAAMWKSERIRLIEQMKSDNTKALMEEADRWRERIEKDKAFREAVGENQLIRRKITTNTSRIRKLLINETDLKNIPEHMKGLARELLGKIVSNDLAGRKITNIEKQNLIETARVLAAMKELDGEYSPDDLRLIADEEAQSVIADALADLEEGLEEYNGRRKGAKEVNVKTVHDQLQKVLDAVTTITGIINAERSVSFLDRQVTVGEAADDVRRDFENTRFRGELKGRGSKAINTARRTMVYGNMTPEYYIENLRNRGMTELWQDMKRGENRNGLEVRKAQEHMARLAEETGYKAWANEKHDVTLGGMKRTLTIGNMMELYAIWQREHTSNPEMSQHLNKGGVYFQDDSEQTGKLRHEQTQQRAIRVTDEEIQAMYDSMTPQQKQLIDGVVKYLSNDMSDLGNEASMRMYGIKKYKETYYFPMKVWDGVKSARSDKGITGTDENRAAHKSWSKRRQHMAQNALVIGDFMTDAVNHIVEMINYNTMAPSIENINKVLNYKFTEEAGTDNETQRNLRVMFQENYGTESLKYLEDLLKDLNGGPAQDQRKTLRDRLLSVFKKNAVAGSMSVALQQPLSYIRAAMMISPKYLAEGLGKFWKGSYEEMITHSGVAVIKDMGRFDMNFGQSAKDYITPETGRNLYEKASDMLTKAPELMDRMTWTRMWSAVKAEQAAKNPGMDIKSEAFMNKVTERFNELMRKTQVYDSILVKSSNMRSTNLGMKVITSFMAEPTLSLNVLADAIRNAGAEGGKKKLTKALATFLVSAVMQAGVKALMGSGRTPDKKKTWTENFLNKLQYNLMNEANPVSLIPGYSDLIEVLKTGELRDDAMGAIGKLFSIVDTTRKAMQGNGKGAYRDLEDTVGQFAQLFTNIPAKNLMRDARAVYNWIAGSEYAQRETSGAVLRYQKEANWFTGDNMLGVLNAWLGEAGFKTTNASYYSRIYQAQKNGNAGEAAGLKEYLSLGKGASDDAIKAGIKAAAKKDTSMTEAERDAWMIDNDLMGENNVSTITTQYKEGKITRAEAEKLYRKLNSSLTDNDLWWKLDRLDYQKETGADSVSGYSYRLKDAIQSNKAEEIRKVIKAMLDHGRTQKQIKDALSDWKSEYLAADAKTKTTIRDALQKAYKAMGLTAADADKVINGWTKEKKKTTK